MNVRHDEPAPSSPESLIGTWRRFEPTGPAYQIIASGPLREGRPAMRVRVLQTDEEIDYPLDDILGDPRET